LLKSISLQCFSYFSLFGAFLATNKYRCNIHLLLHLDAIVMVLVVATIIKCNALLCCNYNMYCNITKICCLNLLPRHLLQRLPAKAILLLSKGITTNMTLLQHYFIIAIYQISSSVLCGSLKYPTSV
jgi:hypothetical protein